MPDDAACSLEDLWYQCGDRVKTAALRRLGDRAAARAAGAQVLVEAADRLAADPSLTCSPALLPWLLDLTRDVCSRAPADAALWNGASSAIEAVPLRVRLHLSWRADDARIAHESGRRDRHFGVFSVAPLLWRRFKAACADLAEHARVLAQRGAPGALTNSSAWPGFTTAALGVPGATEAVAAVAATVAFAIVGPVALPQRGGVTEPPAASIAAVRDASRSARLARSPSPPPERRGRAAPASVPPRTGDAADVPAPALGADGPFVGAPTAGASAPDPGVANRPRPAVEAKPPGSGSKLVETTPHDDQTEHHTPEDGTVTIGEGDDAISVGVPYVVVSCDDPGEQGVVMGTLCPVTGGQDTREPDG
jgi:hypothetical protein